MTRPLGYSAVVGGGSGGAVSSVAGKTGAVTLVAADAGAVPTYATASHTTNFTATVAILHLVDTTGGAVTATLPAANVAGQQVAIKLNAGATAVTVVPSGTDTIGAAATTASITLLAEVWEFVSSGTGQWNLVAGNKSLSSLDGRYAQLAGATFTGEVIATDLKVTGTTGAPNAGRFVGVTTVGAPTSGTYAVGDYSVSKDGMMFICVTAGTPGTWVTPSDTRDALVVGEETFSRTLATNTGISLASQALRLTFFTARKTETTTQVRLSTGSTAAGATPTLCRIGLWTVDASDNGTLVASTANDTALFAAASTSYTRSWSSSYAKIAGQRYAVGPLVVTAATAPTVVGVIPNVDTSITPRLSSVITGLSDLPSTFTGASLPVNVNRPYLAILP